MEFIPIFAILGTLCATLHVDIVVDFTGKVHAPRMAKDVQNVIVLITTLV